MDDFAERTGLTGEGGDFCNRYLWTDAFAVQTFFGIGNLTGESAYRELAVRLIDAVHSVLGKFRPNDERQGWISGLPEDDGRLHPTAGGLRIGKKLPERRHDERYDEEREWDRDGQYFHYLTRWVQTLLLAKQVTGDRRYAEWAAELVKTAEMFMDNSAGKFRMYWKMSTDLSWPLVSSMGAHDPLEGLICAVSAADAAPERAEELKPLIRIFDNYCRGRDWSTIDSLGIGGLLLNMVRVTDLAEKINVPESIRPEKLLADCVDGLELYAMMHRPDMSAEDRIAFRECGLSLGLRVVHPMQIDSLERYMYLADDIENFWATPENQLGLTWREHADINTVSLAASLVASMSPASFTIR